MRSSLEDPVSHYKRLPSGKAGRYQEAAEKLKVKEVLVGDDRYILCLNEEEERKDEAAREAILEHLREELEGGAMSLVGNKGYARYLKVTKGLMRIDEDKVLAESRYDGKYVLRTNTDLAASEVARTYKSLWRVERAFRETKSTLEVRTDLQGTAHQASLAAGVRPPSPVAMTSRHDL